MRIDIIADFACPWCYLGKRRLTRALKHLPQTRTKLIWQPFQLRKPAALLPPSNPFALDIPLISRDDQNFARDEGLKEGIIFNFDRITRRPDTVRAHSLMRLAHSAGRVGAVADAIFRAYFTDGASIDELDTLVDIALNCGLSGRDAKQAILDPGNHNAVLLADRQARQNGITGVPCFIIDRRYVLSGAQEPEFFQPLFDLARENIHPPIP